MLPSCSPRHSRLAFLKNVPLAVHKNGGQDCQSIHLGNLGLNQTKQVLFFSGLVISFALIICLVNLQEMNLACSISLSHWIIFTCEARLSYAAVTKISKMFLARDNKIICLTCTMCPLWVDKGSWLIVVTSKRCFPAGDRESLRICSNNSVLQSRSNQSTFTHSHDRTSHMVSPKEKGARKYTAAICQEAQS